MAAQSAWPQPNRLSVTAGDINIYHARQIADQQISYVLEFPSRLDPARLKRALAVLHQALPILSFVVQARGGHFRRVPGAGDQPALAVLSQPDDPCQQLANFIAAPCSPQRELPLKVLLLRQPSADTLCVKIDHVASDAAGLRCLLGLLAEAYRTGQISQPINHNRGFTQVIRRFSPLALLRALRRDNLPIPGPSVLPASAGAPAAFSEHLCLPPDRFERLHQFARQQQASLNDVLLAALYRAVFQRLSPPEGAYPVMVPVDMRRYLPAAQRTIIGNLSSAIYPRLPAVPGEPFEATLARVKDSMDRLKAGDPGLGALLLMALGSLRGGAMLRDRYRLAAARGSRFINFTNFGVLPDTNGAFGPAGPCQAYGVGPSQAAPGLIIALSTYQHSLHVVAQGRGDPRFQTAAGRLLRDLLAGLPQ